MISPDPSFHTPVSRPPAKGHRLELTVAMVGAASGAVVPAALELMGSMPPAVSLAGLAVGAALPPFIVAVGRHRRVRMGVAVILTSVALALSYSGLTAFAFAAGQQPVVPVPPQVKAIVVPDSTEVSPIGTLGIAVYPETISCDDDGCTELTVISTGSRELRVTSLEFDGAARGNLTATGCEGARLSNGETCTISVAVRPGSGGTATAQLVIHQNLKGPATYVPVNLTAPPEPCPTGHTRVDGECLPPCPNGMERVNGNCEWPQCPGDVVRINGECTNPSQPCPDGTEPVDGSCGEPPQPCPDGTALIDGECGQPPQRCPDGVDPVEGVCEQ